MAATSLEDNAIFAGGTDWMIDFYTNVDVYNTSLTRTNPSGLSQNVASCVGASVGNYALIAGGLLSDLSPVATVEAYTIV